MFCNANKLFCFTTEMASLTHYLGQRADNREDAADAFSLHL